MRTAVYAGSFDPITDGHMYVIKNAIKIFDTVVVAISTNPEKRYMFDREQRKGFVEEAINADDPRHIEVVDIGNSMLVDYALEIGAVAFIRGVRHGDINEEMEMAWMNSSYLCAMRGKPDIPTIFIPTSIDVATCRSSTVRHLLMMGDFKSALGMIPPPHDSNTEKFRKTL